MAKVCSGLIAKKRRHRQKKQRVDEKRNAPRTKNKPKMDGCELIRQSNDNQKMDASLSMKRLFDRAPLK